MEEQRQAPPAEGLFSAKDKKEDPATKPAPKKEDFKDVFQMHAEQVKDRVAAQKKKPINPEEAAAEKTASALNTRSEKKLEAEFEDLEKISEEDLELAEQMIFKGYAEIDVSIPNLKKHKFTICSTSAEEMSIIDDMIFEMVKNAENDEGVVDLPQTRLQSERNALFLAISYRGVDRQELMGDDSVAHLNTIKKALIRVSDLEDIGEMDKAIQLKGSVKKQLKKRRTVIKRMPTPTIDFLSGEKYRFDSRMLKIMSSKHILPKS